MVLMGPSDGEVIHAGKGPQIECFLDMQEGRVEGVFVGGVAGPSGDHNASISQDLKPEAAHRD
jgi:hypothetical protein